MNKKLFVGAAALTTVAVGGYVYYRYTQGCGVAKEIRERALRLFAPDDQTEEDAWEQTEEDAWEQSLAETEVHVMTQEEADKIGLKFKPDGSLDTSGYVTRGSYRQPPKEEPVNG